MRLTGTEEARDPHAVGVRVVRVRLQELLQESGEVNIHYDLVRHEGPAHRRKFFSRVAVDEITMGRGEGMSKKESEQEAARDALSKLATREDLR